MFCINVNVYLEQTVHRVIASVRLCGTPTSGDCIVTWPQEH